MHVPADDSNSRYKDGSESLTNAIDGNGELLRGKSAQGSLDVLSGACSAVNAALSDVLPDCNYAHCDPVLGLPSELICDCFRPLGFRDRLVVSHVSRAWRAFALADPWMWDEAIVKLRDEPVGSELVAALLRRSDPLPFTFAWASSEKVPYMPQDLVDLICEQMGRMESLRIERCPEWMLQGLLTRPANRLRSLAFRTADGPCVLPENWGEGCAAHVEVLDVGDFTLPMTFQPLPSVRSLSGSLHGEASYLWNPTNLFECFPGLRSLRLTHVSPEALEHLGDPPPSLSDLALVLARGHVDYTSFLHSCHSSRIQRLLIRGGYQFSAVVQLFTSVVAAEWHFKIDQNSVTLSSDAGDEYIVRCTRYVLATEDPTFTAYLGHLCSLTLPKGFLYELWGLEGWDRSLPSLRETTIILRPYLHAYPYQKISDDSRAPPIHAPLLDSVRFVVKDAPSAVWMSCEWIRDSFPSLLPRLFARTRTRLASIMIEAGRCVREDEDFTSLRRLADDVRLRTGMEDHFDG